MSLHAINSNVPVYPERTLDGKHLGAAISSMGQPDARLKVHLQVSPRLTRASFLAIASVPLTRSREKSVFAAGTPLCRRGAWERGTYRLTRAVGSARAPPRSRCRT